MTTFTFAPATRETARARIALQGPGGSGKTKTALRMAEGLAKGGAIGVVDTERGSALKYAPVPGRPDIEAHEFAHLPMAFCSPENLIAAVKAAEEARLAVLIIDSWSHFWAGKGGLLARVDEESRKAGNYGGKFTAWGPVNELEQEMLDALLHFPGHVIVTMRTKNDYAMEGKTVTKVGVKTVQREGAEYEVDVVIDMIQGTGTVTKTRYTALDGACVHHPGEDFAEAILEQLGQGVDPVQVIVDELVREGLTYDRALGLHGQAQARNLLGADLLHPKTGEPAKLGDLIREYGQAVKPAATPVTNASSAPSAPPAGQNQGSSAGAPSDAGQDLGLTPVTAPQMRMMHACFSKVGLGHRDSREQRLRATALIIGRPIASANELTKGEAQTLLDTLTNFGERDNAPDEFAAMLQGLEDEAARAAGDALYVAAAQSA
ncbi:AAA family ATPase [Streptomyces sp. ND04-05B]|uniref:AAA family ATPase n=1 Tax=Streptomyces sp. ND04-05B TaxID=3028693 RepID=UPI0029A5892C|nr:AAA family ATPase [Streptomyces sp. ND04-05B]MDX3066914.1 AAA family ATPase [Streptomyces sp. ND04-05B]